MGSNPEEEKFTLHEEQLEIVRMLGGALAFNTVVDEARNLSFVNFGEIVASHIEAVGFARNYAEVPVKRRFKTVLTSAAGYPLDKTDYQTVKGMFGPIDILEPGGRLFRGIHDSMGLTIPGGLRMFRWYGRWLARLSLSEGRRNRVKVPFLILGFIVSAFLTLSATSQAAPRGGFRGGNFRSGRNFAFNQNRRFFRGDRRVFFQQPIWPLYWNTYGYPDDYSYLDNGPDNDFQYADNSAAFVQPETSRSAVRRDPIVIVVNTGNSRPIDPSPNPAFIPSGYSSTQLAGQQRIVSPDPNEQIGPQADPRTVVPLAIQPPQTAEKGVQTKPPTRPGPFGDLVLVSWLEDAGKDVIYVQNTETQDVQKITSEPNLDHFRIVELHPNTDPKLFEAVISNGSQQGAVRFRF